MSVQVSDLRLLQLDLLIEVDLLLSNHIQLPDLVIDDLLSLLQRIVYFLNLILYFFDLLFGILNHLIQILNLGMQVVCELLLLSLLEIILKKILSLEHELGLFLADSGHRSK